MRAPEVKFHLPDSGVHRPRRPLDVVLGVDFGTRRNKVCYRVLQEDRCGIVYAPGKPIGALQPSEVHLSSDGFVDILPSECTGRPTIPLPFIKMRLTAPELTDFAVPEPLRKLCGPDTTEPLAAFYLAHLFASARRTTLRIDTQLHFADVNWEAHIGVPVEIGDSERAQIFHRVACVAWCWSFDIRPLVLLEALKKDYQRTASTVDLDQLPVFAFPELVGALARFAQRRDTPDAYYGCVDIGGGTLDVAFFRVRRDNPGPPLDIYSATVKPEGTAALAARAGSYSSGLSASHVERALVVNRPPLPDCFETKEFRKPVQDAVCRALDEARKKVSRFTNIFATQPPDESRPTLNRQAAPPLELFVTGGGAPSEWYRTTICAAHSERKLDRLAPSIGSFHLRTVDLPSNFRVPAELEPGRFLVAEGLSTPYEELHAVLGRMPSQIQDSPPLPPRERPPVSYADSKDALT